MIRDIANALQQHRRSKLLSLAALLIISAVVFVRTLPFLDVDRMQENVYLGEPYQMIAQHRVEVTTGDPFPEMGPQSVYPAAWLAFHFGSLAPVRYFHFGFSLLVLTLLFFFLFRRWPASTLPSWGVGVLTLLMFTTWYTIPLSLVYPAQVNGMIMGFACLMVGLFLLEKHPYAAVMAFGFAYSCKGQFLALYPGMLVYFLVFDQRYEGWTRTLLHTLACGFLFFVPNSLIVAGGAYALGMFKSRQIYVDYALLGPRLLRDELHYCFARLLGVTAQIVDVEAVAQATQTRRTEYAGFGIVTWAHVALSFGFCILYGLWSVVERIRFRHSRKLSDRALTAFSCMAGLYWINYLFLYRYPYWYNVYAVILLNVFFASATVLFLFSNIERLRGAQWAKGFLLLIVLFCSIRLSHSYRDSPARRNAALGNSLEPYAWMKK